MCGSISQILTRYYCYYGKEKLEKIKANIYNWPETEGSLSKGSGRDLSLTTIRLHNRRVMVRKGEVS